MSLLSHKASASIPRPALLISLTCLAAAVLTACGGGTASTGADAADAGTSTTTTTVATTSTASTSGVADATELSALEVLPTFHMAPAQLAEPSDVDAGGTNASAASAPQSFDIDPAMSGVDSTRLTPQALANQLRAHVASASTTPKTTAITAAVYTPAQIRAAYGLSALPTTTVGLSTAAAAALGAGQTIYLIDAYDDANAFADLNRFSTKFGVPTCTSVALTTTSKLPLATPPSSCTFSVAYTDSAAALKSAAPSYNSGWAPEISLDVQWAHAIAPLARIVLIEVASSSTTDLLGGVALANKMGAGVVSMSFGVGEGSWVTGLDSSFTTTGMTYIASSGDSGTQVNWPAVSPHVLAVGGTSLAWSGSGTRYEAAWSGSGGGISAYEALPTWQSGVTMPGSGTLTRRAVSDVSFNADPNTGQYVAVTAPGSTTTNWNAYGGTSIGAPQWAGMVAVANAQRVAASKAVLGDVHSAIYTTIGAVAGTYAAAFADVVAGSDGSCATCAAATGYDQPTGWGTPNAASLLSSLSGAATATVVAVAPTVPGGSFTAQTGTAFSQSLGITAPTGVTTTYALSGAPSGLTVDTTGTLKWSAPVAGSYSFAATATTSAGKSASATYKLAVTAVNHAPTLASGTLTVKAGASFSVKLSGSDADGDAITYTMTGAPSGLALTTAGVLSWTKAVKGTYSLKITPKDSHGLSGAAATITLTVTA